MSKILFVTPWTIAHQALLSMQFHWSELPFHSPEDLTNEGPNQGLLPCRQILYCLSHQKSTYTETNLKKDVIPKKGSKLTM